MDIETVKLIIQVNFAENMKVWTITLSFNKFMQYKICLNKKL